MDLYFLRHTTVAVDNDVCYGQTEIPVASSFLQEASDTMKLVPDKMHAVYFSSPTRRCIQLAEFISKRPSMQDPRLSDLNFGTWERKKWSEIDEEELESWMNDVIYKAPPEGESYEQLILRVKDFFEEVVTKNYKTVVISTHASIVRAILSYVLEIPYQRTFDMQIAFGSITKISVDGASVTVEYINRV
ncbi:MAG: histidine phosphatase family protein [Candidatus Kapaibacteriota bacterium]|jgi:alpha-ribazole phosphatase